MSTNQMPTCQWQARTALRLALAEHREIKACLRILRSDCPIWDEYKKGAKLTRWRVRRAVAMLRFTIKFPRP